MDNGYISLYRKLLNWEWYTDVNAKTLFIHCLLRANYKDNKWRGIEIKRGQFLTSLSSLSKESGLSERQVRTALDKLILTNELTSNSNNKYRIITVLKYNEYQLVDKQDDKELTSKRQTDDKQATTNNNSNKVKKENKVINKTYMADAELNGLFIEFLEIRKKKKAVNTERAINIQLGKLKDLPTEVQKEMLENAIGNSWKSLYPLKDNGYSNKQETKAYEPDWVEDVMKDL